MGRTGKLQHIVSRAPSPISCVKGKKKISNENSTVKLKINSEHMGRYISTLYQTLWKMSAGEE